MKRILNFCKVISFVSLGFSALSFAGNCPPGYWCNKETKGIETTAEESIVAGCRLGFWCAKKELDLKDSISVELAFCIPDTKWCFDEDGGSRA